jgi:biopolymer transport protein ExbD
MAGGGGSGKKASSLSVNLTPMIDCTMLLVIFFLLTTQLASPDFSQMDLPNPTVSQAVEHEGDRAVIQVVPFSAPEIRAEAHRAREASEYRIAGIHYKTTDTGPMLAKIEELRAHSPKPADFTVEVRSDAAIDFTQVEPIFKIIQDAKVQKMHVAAIRG